MKKIEYPIADLPELKSVVWECTRQKDILCILDEMLDKVNTFGWSYIFADDSFYIEYKDGSTYSADYSGEYGIYQKRNIHRIIYVNDNDTQVYGDYYIDELGIVS